MKIKESDEKWSSGWKNFRKALSRILFSPRGGKLSICLAIIVFVLLVIIAGLGVFITTPDSGKEITVSLLYKMNIEPRAVVSALDGIKSENIRIPGHVVQGLMATPDHISIDIKNNDFQNLSKQREAALSQGIWTGTDQYIPATIRYRDEKIKAGVKLKGNSIEHWGTDAWSLKVKTNGDDRFLGMKEFSIQKPWTRAYLAEWVYQRLCANEDIPYLQLSFVDVELNGKDVGIYTVEEAPDDRLLDSKGYIPGPIFHFKAGIWDALAAGYERKDAIMVNPLDLYNEGRYNSSPVVRDEARKASDLFEAYRDGSVSANDSFNIRSLAKFWALSDLTGGYNGIYASNIRPYYNPVTSKFEYVGHDAKFTQISEINYIRQYQFYDQFYKPLFEDPAFVRFYVQELERVSDPGYLDMFFSANNPDFQQNLSMIYKENPFYHFPRETFEQNQKIIRQTIYPFRCEYSYLHNVSSDGTVNIDSISAQPMPVEVLGLRLNGTLLPRTGGPGILDGYKHGDAIMYQTLSFRLPEGINQLNATDNLTLECRVYGTTPVRTEPVFKKALFSDWALGEDIVRQSSNTEQFSWLTKDEKNLTFSIPPGIWEISRDLIIPGGYTVISPEGGGTRLDLTHGAMILSYSPLRLQGNEELPFEVTSSDGSGQGILLLNVENVSVFSYVRISNLSVPDRNGWRVPASMTFYQSPIVIDHAEFNHGTVNGSLLSIVRSNAIISGSRFMGSKGDLVTISYGSLEVSDSHFLGPAVSGLTGTGSTIHVSGSRLDGPLAIGIRGMRTSTITIESSYFSGARVSGTAEDGSKITISDCGINSGVIGLAAYQNTPGYGPGTVVADNVQMVNTQTPYLSEKGSTITVGSSIVPVSKDQIVPQIREIAGISP